jgi:hypothetical protein
MLDVRSRLVGLGRAARQPRRTSAEIGLPHVDVRRQDVFDHLLRPVGALVGGVNGLLREDLVCNHPDRQTRANGAGET